MKRKILTILIAVLSIQFTINLSAECIKGNCFNGYGTYAFADGSQYIGEFKDDKFHGQGTFNFASGSQYIGEYKDDKRHGQGTYNFASGDQYIGEFKDGKKHGQGTYSYASGNQYVGEWKDDKKHGQGTKIWFLGGDQYTAEFSKQTGIWENDEYIGTVFELEEKRKAEEERRKVQEAKYQKMMDEAEEERKRWDKIYNACLLDKGTDVDMTSTTMAKAVRSTCKGIAENPSFLESWKYE